MAAVAGAADIGGTNTRVALIGDDGVIIATERFPTPRGSDPRAVVAAVTASLHRLLSAGPPRVLCGIGVSVAGPVDRDAGIILHPPNMPFDEVPITAPLRDTFALPVFLANDCRAAVRGEVFAGGGKGYQHLVYLTFSTGIGGGVYSHGEVLTGRGGNAGEIGHILVDTTSQQTCSCGGTGHWEGYASGRGIPLFYQTWCRTHGMIPVSPCSTAEEIFTAASAGEPSASLFMHALARVNSRGLSTVIVAYDPEIIILDGPVVTNHFALVMQPAIEHLDEYLPRPGIIISPLGGDAPLLGAAAGVFDSAGL